MYFEIIELLKKMEKYNKVLIYGTGNYAQRISCVLQKCDVWEKVSNFVVSKLQNIEAKEIEGVPVIAIGQLEKIDDNTAILVAVGKQYLYEIEQVLHEKGLRENCFFLPDFEKQENLEAWDEKRNFSELYKYIIQWCLSNQINEIGINVVNGWSDIKFIPLKKSLQETDPRLIVFIVGMITARTSRIVMALKKYSYQIKIFKWWKGADYVGEPELQRANIEIINCGTEEEILFWALKEKPLVYYIDPPWERNTISKIMLVYREYFGKIVMAPYDVLNLTHIRARKMDYDLERYALENADGVVWRYFSREPLQKRFGFEYRGDTIDFLDYCEQYELPVKKGDNKILKLCCLPTHTKPFLQNIDEDFGFAREATAWEIMDKIGERTDCEFHVFFWERPDEEDMGTINKMKQKYSNFYYYVRIDHEKLISWIAEYDYGVVLSIDGSVPEWPNTLKVGLEYYHSEGVYRYASQNKFYDFLNAHLPIVATYPTKLCDVLSKYGVIINMSLEKLNIDYLKSNKEIFYKNAVKAHEKLLIDKHIPRLIEFFNCVYRGK